MASSASSGSASSSGHRGAADAEQADDLSKLSASQLVSYLLRGPAPPSADNPEDLVAVVRELSAREARHEALRQSTSRIRDEIHGHLTAAMAKIHGAHEEGAFRLSAKLSASGRSAIQQEAALQKSRLRRITAEAKAKVESSFSRVIGAPAETSSSRGGRGRGRGRGSGISITPAQARAAAAVTYLSDQENDLAAPLNSTVLVGRSDYSLLLRRGKVPVVECMDSEEERYGREEEEIIEAMKAKRAKMRAASSSADEDSSGSS